MKAERLFMDFSDLGMAADDGRLVFCRDDAVALVNAAADEGVPVVALSALPDVHAAPDREVVDFSRRVAQGHGCWHEAEAFIASHPGRLFALTLGDDPVEAV